jgi:hypothetical protein
MSWAIEMIKGLVSGGFTGRIEINFYCGGITNINKIESFQPPKGERQGYRRVYKQVVVSTESIV